MSVQDLAAWSIVAFFVIWLFSFLVIVLYRFKEERLHTRWKKEAKEIENQAIPMPTVEGQLKNLDKKFQPQLDKLERQKQFLRDILPFIKG